VGFRRCALEGLVKQGFWAGKRVLLTGHTGFKGSWLSLWLAQLGATVSGCALPPEGQRNLFEAADVAQHIDHRLCDIRDLESLGDALRSVQPDVVLHLAAQSLVRRSYVRPIETYQTNVMGTLNLLEAVRSADGVRSCVIVTTDKCYENKEQQQPYREPDPLGGFDPYSSSKACTEILAASFRRSFFSAADGATAVATARAGNVIGGGDWAEDRLIPDAVTAFAARKTLKIRNPDAVRPWQHVLEPLYGYLLLAERLYDQGAEFAEAWNFGPRDAAQATVATVIERLAAQWGEGARWETIDTPQPHEAGQLTLDSQKARRRLGWHPATSLEQALALTTDWYKAFAADGDMQRLCFDQIDAFQRAIIDADS